MSVGELMHELEKAECKDEKVTLRIVGDGVTMQGANNMRTADTGTTSYIISGDMPLTW